MANLNISTQEAANGFIIHVTFFNNQNNQWGAGLAQNAIQEGYYNNGGTRNRSYIAKDKAEMREILLNLMEGNND